MKKILFILLLNSLMFASCSKKAESDAGEIRFMFDAGDLRFISSSFNPIQQTMSALYGNQQAVVLLSGFNKRLPHSSFKLVTYQMQADPNYFGSKVNGELLSVETLKTDIKGNLEYEIEFGKMPSSQNKGQRIANILDHEPVKFPQ
ncbi:hypothetical protein [Sphingobacterium sp.]|uniref:hypothetical protein n=1 Tax=Sphingobacterium sp. TaxID=341027 RepID=UPI00289A4C07|nr:hypothetical protein [Sphingobacterium sp.]